MSLPIEIMSKIVFKIILYLNYVLRCQSKFEGFIVEGKLSKIENFPYSVYLESFCNNMKTAMCGSSLLNQWILITAAHCMPSEDCVEVKTIRIRYGHVNKSIGFDMRTRIYKAHEDYRESGIANDIALVMLEKPIPLNRNISRVSIQKKNVYDGQMATVAGWGYIDDSEVKLKTKVLKNTIQKIITREECQNQLGRLPQGVFCANDPNKISRPSGGDSGSALVVDGYNQVGLVSYRLTEVDKSTIVYTDIPHFYAWIAETAKKLFCENAQKIKT